MPVAATALTLVGGFGPSLAAVAVVAYQGGRSGLRRWLSRCLQWRAGRLDGSVCAERRCSSVLFAWLFNRTEGSVLPVLVLHTAVNAWSSVIPVMVLPDGSNLRPFQWVVGILVVAALRLLFRGGPTPHAGSAALQARP